MSEIRSRCLQFVASRYGAIGAFFYGSAQRGTSVEASDIDLIVVSEQAVAGYREKIRNDEYLFDVFVYDAEALNGAMLIGRNNGNMVISRSVATAEILAATNGSSAMLMNLQQSARSIVDAGIGPRNLISQRQSVTALIDDLIQSRDSMEQAYICSELFDCVISLVTQKYGELGGTKRYASKILAEKDPAFSLALLNSYSNALRGDTVEFLRICRAVLELAGGELREGFKIRLPDTLRVPLFNFQGRLVVKLYAFLLAFLSATCAACDKAEDLVFECKTDAKVVSVCRTNAAGNGDLRIKYRFAKIGGAPEMSYPEAPKSAREAFSFDYIGLNGGERSILSFKNGKYEYLVHHTSMNNQYSEMQNEAGVRVFLGGSVVADIACRLDSVRDNMFATFNKAGLPGRP